MLGLETVNHDNDSERYVVNLMISQVNVNVEVSHRVVPLINPGEWGYLPGTNTVTRAVCNSVLEETPQVQEGTVSSQVVRWEDGPAVNRGGSVCQ